LKADIQRLLKELSQEIQSLQAQVAAQHKDLPNPLPGTTTDPQLYEGASSVEQATGPPLLLQLDVDQQPISTTRPGTGVAKPSGQVAQATPQQSPQDVALAEQATEEQAVSRQPIPPEYKPVFERLSNQTQQP
jgi:hypothetical protein